VDPLEKADDKAKNGNQNSASQIYYCYLYLTVHAIVKRRKTTTRDKKIDSCIVKSISNCICFYIDKGILADIG
jgi:hypothetical protein